MDKKINLFGDMRVNDIMSATIINEYCKRELLEETLDPPSLWGGDSG